MGEESDRNYDFVRRFVSGVLFLVVVVEAASTSGCLETVAEESKTDTIKRHTEGEV